MLNTYDSRGIINDIFWIFFLNQLKFIVLKLF